MPFVGRQVPESDTPLLGGTQESGRSAVSLAERHARTDQSLGKVRRVQALVVERGSHRLDVEPQRSDRSRDRRKDDLERFHRIEGRLLVLLQVAVVAER